jgi:hypothetical protein
MLEKFNKVDCIFYCHSYLGRKKVKLMVIEFTNSMIIQWIRLGLLGGGIRRDLLIHGMI